MSTARWIRPDVSAAGGNVEWARIGHDLGRRAVAVHSDSAAAAIFEVAGTERYVQWHGEHGEAFYLEASSGLYVGPELDPWQQTSLINLGWARPREGWGKDHVLNWSRYYEAPVSLYDVVRLTVATLRDVFGAQPDTVVVR